MTPQQLIATARGAETAAERLAAVETAAATIAPDVLGDAALLHFADAPREVRVRIAVELLAHDLAEACDLDAPPTLTAD